MVTELLNSCLAVVDNNELPIISLFAFLLQCGKHRLWKESGGGEGHGLMAYNWSLSAKPWAGYMCTPKSDSKT